MHGWSWMESWKCKELTSWGHSLLCPTRSKQPKLYSKRRIQFGWSSQRWFQCSLKKLTSSPSARHYKAASMTPSFAHILWHSNVCAIQNGIWLEAQETHLQTVWETIWEFQQLISYESPKSCMRLTTLICAYGKLLAVCLFTVPCKRRYPLSQWGSQLNRSSTTCFLLKHLGLLQWSKSPETVRSNFQQCCQGRIWPYDTICWWHCATITFCSLGATKNAVEVHPQLDVIANPYLPRNFCKEYSSELTRLGPNNLEGVQGSFPRLIANKKCKFIYYATLLPRSRRSR